jgi:hypothetical protein
MSSCLKMSLGFVLAMVSAVASREAKAQGSQLPPVRPVPAYKPERFHFAYKVAAAGRINPLGLFLGGAILARYRLYDSQSLALRDNYVAVGPVVFLSPAFARVGLGAEIQPLSVFQLSASYEFIGYFSSFDMLQTFPTPTANVGDAALKANGRAGLNYATYGGIFTLAGLLQGKLGPIVARSNVRLFHYMLKARPGDTVYYDSTLDVMSPTRGFTITDDTDVFWVSSFGLAAGLRYTVTHSFFSKNDFLPGEPELSGNSVYVENSPTHRLGPIIAYTFFDDDERKVNAPTLILLAQWYLRHRYRTGQEVAHGFPQIAIAFQFKGIL